MKKNRIKYVKSKDYKVNQATGAFGGISGNGTICINFYLDTVPLPDISDVDIAKNGMILEGSFDSKGIISERQLNSGVILDLNTAKNFHNWLGDKITELEKAINHKK